MLNLKDLIINTLKIFQIKPIAPLKIIGVILICIIAFILHRCVYSEENINRVEPILYSSLQIKTTFGKVEEYKIKKYAISFGTYPDKKAYRYTLYVKGSRDNGYITLYVDPNKESKDYPYRIEFY